MNKNARSKCNKALSQLAKGDMVVLKGEKCEELYKLKEENSVQGEVSEINLKGSSSHGGASRKTVTGHEPGQSVVGMRKRAFERGSR